MTRRIDALRDTYNALEKALEEVRMTQTSGDIYIANDDDIKQFEAATQRAADSIDEALAVLRRQPYGFLRREF